MTTAAPPVDVLARADLLLFAGRLLAPPAPATWAAEPADVRALAEKAGAGPRVADLLERTARAARDADEATWRREHTRLFEGPVACPVNETAFVRRDKGAIIADLCGFYTAFGFEPARVSGEKPDHLVCELEFAAMLLVLLAQARAGGDDEAADVTRGALRSFLADHLGEWLPLAARRLVETSSLPVHHLAAEVLAAAWDTVAGDLDLPSCDELAAAAIPAGPADADDDETPYECGMAPDPGGEPDFVPLTTPAPIDP
ncbi:MAG: TorD/DmsD family molecular chaperone [Planctomycetota bacterium]|jgi:nitrate reductase assembly molybdenum cofactor insertion protein NarJ